MPLVINKDNTENDIICVIIALLAAMWDCCLVSDLDIPKTMAEQRRETEWEK